MSMQNMLMRTFSNFDRAQEARQALLAAGFTADRISFTAGEDEAGPVTGNFMIDREKDPYSRRKTPNFMEGHDPNEVQDTAPADWGRSYLLMVDADDAAESRMAIDIAERFGGMDVNRVTGSDQT